MTIAFFLRKVKNLGMKYFPVFLGLLLVGCKDKQPSIVGEYRQENTMGIDSNMPFVLVLRKDGIAEISGFTTGKWNVTNNEVVVSYVSTFDKEESQWDNYYRVDESGDLLEIARTISGKRVENFEKDFKRLKKVK